MSTIRTSVFATASTNADQVDTLIRTGLEACSASGEIDWSKVDSGDIKYSRAWLIVRRAWIEENTPELLVTLPELMGLEAAESVRKHGEIIAALRDQALSWGEIAVRVGRPESYVRQAFKSGGIRKDIGLRINKGGRFAYGDPTLYLDNMKVEGAHIPADLKGRPAAEQCLNYKAEDATSDEAVKPARRSRKTA